MRLRGDVVLLLVLLFMCRTSAAKKRKKDDDSTDKKVAMLHHSFAVPLAYEEVLNEWMVSGASLVERERLLMHPSVSERAGFMWNKAPLLTNDFEVVVHFRVVGPKGTEQAVTDQSFALWYVHENITAGYNESKVVKATDWKAGMDEYGMTLSGSKAKFHGVGAILSMADSQGKAKSIVSGVWNDGTKDLVYGKDVPTSSAKAIDFRNTMNAAQLKLRVTPTSIDGYFKSSPSLSWNECFKIDRAGDGVRPGGYIGLSAWSGTASANTVSDMVEVMKFEVNNFDTTSVGEEMTDVGLVVQQTYQDMITDEHRHFVDQASQTEHLAKLTQMLTNHCDANKPAEEKMFQDLERLQGRMGRMDEDIKTLVTELQVLVGPKGESGSDISSHVIGLRKLLVKDSQAHTETLVMVQKKMSEVKQKHIDASRPELFDEVVSHSERLQATVAGSSQQTTWMLLAIVIVLVVIGGLMRNRMQYYERKHFL